MTRPTVQRTRGGLKSAAGVHAGSERVSLERVARDTVKRVRVMRGRVTPGCVMRGRVTPAGVAGVRAGGASVVRGPARQAGQGTWRAMPTAAACQAGTAETRPGADQEPAMSLVVWPILARGVEPRAPGAATTPSA